MLYYNALLVVKYMLVSPRKLFQQCSKMPSPTNVDMYQTIPSFFSNMIFIKKYEILDVIRFQQQTPWTLQCFVAMITLLLHMAVAATLKLHTPTPTWIGRFAT